MARDEDNSYPYREPIRADHIYNQDDAQDYTSGTYIYKEPEQKKQMILEGEAEEYDWKDIDDEEFRVYVFPCGEVVIYEPLYLNVSESRGHRIFDNEGVCHYIPTGWIHLWWKAKEGEANFRF